MVPFDFEIHSIYYFFQQYWNKGEKRAKLPGLIKTFFFILVKLAPNCLLFQSRICVCLFEVFLRALVEPRKANCSVGLGLSNNLRVVRFCEVFARMCVVCVPDLMWHLKRCDSSQCLQREATTVLSRCGGCLHPAMPSIPQERNWKEGDMARRLMKFDSFQPQPLCDYILRIHTKTKKCATGIESFIDFWGQCLLTGLCKSSQSRLSIKARSRAEAIQTMLCQDMRADEASGLQGTQPTSKCQHIFSIRLYDWSRTLFR